MNRLTIIGNLCNDPVIKDTQDGKKVCNFNVAVNRRKKDANGNSIADFFRVSAWNAMGENCQKYLAKGKKVGVSGAVSVHPFIAQDGTAKATIEVFAEDVEFLTPVGSTEQSATAPAAEPAVQPSMTPVNMDGELPF